MNRFALACCCLALPMIAAGADDLNIDWFTVDGGGGTSSTSELMLSGTIGQPDAGALACHCCDSGLTCFGGFWSHFIEVDQPDGPWLCLRLTDTNTFLLSWRAYFPGFILQQRGLNSPGWSDVPTAPVVVRTDHEVTVDDLAGWVATVCTNQPSGSLVTNLGPHLTGHGWYLYRQSIGPNPPPDCRYPVFCPTNEPTFFRLRRP